MSLLTAVFGVVALLAPLGLLIGVTDFSLIMESDFLNSSTLLTSFPIPMSSCEGSGVLDVAGDNISFVNCSGSDEINVVKWKNKYDSLHIFVFLLIVSELTKA